MFKKIAKFTADNQTLTIVAAQGKSGINVKASVKTGKGKGQPKAVTGGREKFDNEVDAVKAFDKLVRVAVSKGWTSVARTVKNAFTVNELPGPTAPVVKLTKAQRKQARIEAAAAAAEVENTDDVVNA